MEMPAAPLRLASVRPVIVLFEALMVLLVRVSVPFRVARVPVVGRVNVVVPVVVSVTLFAPEVVKSPSVEILPPRVMVLPVLATPVPPYWPVITLPFHVPDVTVPNVVMFDEPV